MSFFPVRHGAKMLLALLFSTAAHAADDANTPVLKPLTITAPDSGSLTQPDVETQHDTLNQTVGSIGFVDSEDYRNRYAGSIRQVLQDAPGVLVEQRYGQEMRLSMRGSGLARGYHTRGIEILQDGIPMNAADGSGDFYQIDPLGLRSVEVYKGGNALAFGSTTLGGAINFVTPTAYTAIAPNMFRLEGGSYNTVRGNAAIARAYGDVDFLAGGSTSYSHGYRDHEIGKYAQFNGNIGYRINDRVETRFYLGAYLVDQQLPGTLTMSDALHHPTKAAASSLTGNQARNSRTERIANRTSISLDTGQIDVDSWAIHKSLFHPIFQVIDQDGWTYGLAPRYTASLKLWSRRNDLIVGGRIFAGTTDADQYVNLAGSRGQQTLDAKQKAQNYEAYFENRFFFFDKVALMTGAKAFHDSRDYTDRRNRQNSANADYDGVNPKIGLLWEPEKDVQAFVDVTRSADVPDFTDLAQTQANGATGFVPISAQHAYTLEAGTRGSLDRVGWDITAYHSWVRDQMLQFTVSPDIPASTFNADRTMLQGIEFSGWVDVARHILDGKTDDNLRLTQLWNFSDFRFDGDAQYGDNQIAGVPRNVLRTTLTYSHPDGFSFAPVLDWVPNGPWADNANTLKVPGYALIGFQAGMDWDNGMSLYLDARNLTNKHYITDVSTVTDARKVSTAIFYPGDGASLYAGLRYTF